MSNSLRRFACLPRVGLGLCVAAGLLSSSLSAEPRAEIQPQLAQPGAVGLHDEFDRSSLGDDWKIAKGSWTIEDGTLVGKELPADKHAAVATIGGVNRNSIVRFSFQLNGPKQFAVSLNKKQGHLFRVTIAENGLTLMLDKDKKDPDSKTQVLAKAQGVIEPNKWHTLQLEIVGDQVVAQTDSGLKVAGRHASLDTEKVGYRFVVAGESVRIDDLRIASIAN